MWCCLFKHPSSSTCIAVPRLCEHLLYMGTPTCVCTRCTVRLFGVDIWMVCDVFYGVFPHTMSELMSLPPPPDALRGVVQVVVPVPWCRRGCNDTAVVPPLSRCWRQRHAVRSGLASRLRAGVTPSSAVTAVAVCSVHSWLAPPN